MSSAAQRADSYFRVLGTTDIIITDVLKHDLGCRAIKKSIASELCSEKHRVTPLLDSLCLISERGHTNKAEAKSGLTQDRHMEGKSY